MIGTLALAIDPGTRKCGIAVVQNDAPPRTQYREVVTTPDLPAAISKIIARFPANVVLIGDATNAQIVESVVRPLLPSSIAIEFVAEAFTSERARARWCRENPPTNLWERLFPGLRTPAEPVDDYAAVILAEQYFAAQS
ncbi:MAG: pre-16S rRNA-processing nuclease YqgF [Akkermansiaceae bacterium]|nr:pre-16S rRNA-processing nuclease YqgF [Armatimonadota bacterium]